MPKVSVIIPTHNRAEFLRSAIASVLKQTYQDFEVIVVDDASDEACHDVLSYFGENRIKYIRHEVNKGDAGSRNTGILNSSGDYLAFLDDDDEWLPEKLQMQVDLLRNSSAKAGGVYTGSLTIEKMSGKILGVKVPKKKRDPFQEILLDNFIATSSIVLKRECFETVGLFDETIPYNSDYDMWIRIARKYCFECIQEPLFIYHTHRTKLNTNLKLVLQGHEIVLEKYDKYFATNGRNLSRLYYTLGILYSLNGSVDKSRTSFFNAIKLHPFAIKHYMALIVSLAHTDALASLIKMNERITTPLREKRLQRQLDSLATSSSLTTVRSMCRSGWPLTESN